jgi:hypothetical protein
VVMFAMAVSSQGNANVRSQDIVVESPSDLPEPAQNRSEAMHLAYIGTSRVILYLEQEQGRKLAILDVTDPASIQAVGQVSIDAPAPFDFVQDIGDSATLIHYRNHSGFAVIRFKNYKKPVLMGEPDYLHPADVQTFGAHGLLLESPNGPSAPAQDPQYEILSIPNSGSPTPLATIKGVMERLDRPQTGTIFLLNDDGLTVVRCLASEREYALALANQKAACCR